MARRIIATSTDYKIRENDLEVRVTAGTSTITITLPDADGARKDHEFRVSVASITGGTGVVSIVPSGSDTIDGRTSITLTRLYQVVTFVTDGANWHVKAHGGLSLRFGSYGTPVPYDGVGLCNMYSADIGGSAGTLTGFWYAKGTGTGELICFQPLIESDTAVTGPSTMKTVDALCGLVSATAKLAAVANSAEGMFALRGKVYCTDGATAAASSRIAALFLDTALNGANILAADIYSIYALNDGGGPCDAFARLNGQNGGKWTNLFSFPSATMQPLAAVGVYKTPQSNDATYFLTCDVNGTPYGIPLMAV
jgi:hypothetical protein